MDDLKCFLNEFRSIIGEIEIADTEIRRRLKEVGLNTEKGKRIWNSFRAIRPRQEVRNGPDWIIKAHVREIIERAEQNVSGEEMSLPTAAEICMVMAQISPWNRLSDSVSTAYCLAFRKAIEYAGPDAPDVAREAIPMAELTKMFWEVNFSDFNKTLRVEARGKAWEEDKDLPIPKDIKLE